MNASFYVLFVCRNRHEWENHAIKGISLEEFFSLPIWPHPCVNALPEVYGANQTFELRGRNPISQIRNLLAILLLIEPNQCLIPL
jgi:hypothetical protein